MAFGCLFFMDHLLTKPVTGFTEATNVSPSPGGEGRGEGGRKPTFH